MPVFNIYSFADFGVLDNSFVFDQGGTMTLGASATTNVLHMSDDDAYLDPLANNDLDQVLTSNLYIDGVLVGMIGDNVTSIGAAVAQFDVPGHPGLLSVLTTISINGVPVGFGSHVPISPSTQITNYNPLGFVSINYGIIRCFTKGTKIACKNGSNPVEALQLGDLVHTKANGLQAVRWVYRQTVSGLGPFAPICFKAGAIGNEADLVVSPQHRMLIQGPKAEALFGEHAFLAHAKDLCNGRNIFPKPSAKITYFHILFDQHELVNTYGCWSESFAASSEAIDDMEEAVKAELHEIFPDLCHKWRDALPTLSAAESALLFQ